MKQTFIAAVLAAGLAGSAEAQQFFGALRGVVTDSAGAGVPQAIVTLGRTSFATPTDANGRFEFALVPAGRYTIEAGGPGVVRGERVGVHVRAGAVTNADITLGATLLWTATDPVERSSRTVFPGEELSTSSTDDPRQALVGSPGAVLRGGEIGVTSQVGFSVRGGPQGGAAAWVDGAPVRFRTFGDHTLVPPANALDEVSLTTGISSASVADAGGGGVIGYVTRSGGLSVRGSARLETEQSLGGLGYSRIAADVGGPAPGLRNLTWFVSAQLQGQESAYRGIGAEDVPLYALGGVDTVVLNTSFGQNVLDTLRTFVPVAERTLPMDWTSRRLLHGRVQYTWGSGGSLSVTGLTHDFQQRFYPGRALMNPGLYAGSRAWSRLVVVNVGQPVGRLAGQPMVLEVNASLAGDDEQGGVLTRESEAQSRDPWLGIETGTLRFTGLDSLPFPIDETYIRRLRNNNAPFTAFPGRNDLLVTQRARTNPYGVVTGWPTQGIDSRVGFVRERRFNARWQVHARPCPRHHATVGLDYDRTSLTAFDAALVDPISLEAYMARPWRLGVFASDRWERGALTVDAGLRYDRFASGADFPKVAGRIFSHPAWTISPTDDTAYANSLARVYDRGRTQGALSPRVRIGYAVDARTSARLGVGRQVEPPQLRGLYAHINTDLNYSPTSTLFGSDAELATTTLWELGVRRAWTPSLATDVVIYHTSVGGYGTQFVPQLDPATQSTIVLPRFVRRETRDLTGVEARVEQRSAWMTAALSYGYLNNALPSFPDTISSHAWYGAVAFHAPEAWDPGGAAGAALRGTEVLLTLRATNGLSYGRLVNVGSGIVTPGIFGTTAGPARLPWTRVLDLRVARSVRIAGRTWTLFADARNVLNLRNLVSAFAETRTDTNGLHRLVLAAPESVILQIEAQNNNALEPDGSTVNLRGNCNAWQVQTNCVALRRVERLFGDGDGLYTLAEQQRAFNAYYDAFFGRARFYGPGRTLRLGLELQR